MVEEIIKYKCEICGMVYDKLVQAVDCESKGIISLHPIGTIFCMYNDITMVFVIIKQYPNKFGHNHSYSTWACRDTKAGDNCGAEDFCGLESWDKIYTPDKTVPAYNRMLEALRAVNIEPIDYKDTIGCKDGVD